MRDRIRERLTEYREEAHKRIGSAMAKTKSEFAGRGTLSSSMCYLAVNTDNETGLAEYMDRSIHFIRGVASGSWTEYVDELRDAEQKLKQDIMDSWLVTLVVNSVASLSRHSTNCHPPSSDRIVC
jgi:hypothetical protein